MIIDWDLPVCYTQVELGEEEALLRDKAIKTLDLRTRIENKLGGQVFQ
jgi:hypothetical protein